MKRTIFALGVLVVLVALAQARPPSRTVETTVDLEYDYDYDYDRKSSYKVESRPEYIEVM